MKRNFYKLLLLLITFNAEAQIEKGLFSIGVSSPEIWKRGTPDDNSRYFKKGNRSSGINLNGQYFFTKNFSAEIGLNYTKNIVSDANTSNNLTIETENIYKTRGILIGANYYYPVRKNLYIKASINYIFYKDITHRSIFNPYYSPSYFEQTDSDKYQSLNLNAGLVYFLSKKFSLDLKLGGLTRYNYGDGYSNTQLNFRPYNWNIGLSYYPNAKTEKKRKNASIDSTNNLNDTTKKKADSTYNLNDNVLKGRTFYFPNGTPLDAGEVYIEPTIIPLDVVGFIPIIDVGLGKGFSISVAPLFSLIDMDWEDYYFLANLKYARKVSNKWSLSANAILWANVYEGTKKKYVDYTIFPTFAATRTGRKSELSFGLGLGFGISENTYLANIGYMQKIGRRWAYTTDNLFHINKYDGIALVTSHTFKYHVSKNFNFDFGVMAMSYPFDGEVYPLPLIKASYHFPGKKSKPKVAKQ